MEPTLVCIRAIFSHVLKQWASAAFLLCYYSLLWCYLCWLSLPALNTKRHTKKQNYFFLVCVILSLLPRNLAFVPCPRELQGHICLCISIIFTPLYQIGQIGAYFHCTSWDKCFWNISYLHHWVPKGHKTTVHIAAVLQTKCQKVYISFTHNSWSLRSFNSFFTP